MWELILTLYINPHPLGRRHGPRRYNPSLQFRCRRYHVRDNGTLPNPLRARTRATVAPLQPLRAAARAGARAQHEALPYVLPCQLLRESPFPRRTPLPSHLLPAQSPRCQRAHKDLHMSVCRPADDSGYTAVWGVRFEDNRFDSYRDIAPEPCMSTPLTRGWVCPATELIGLPIYIAPAGTVKYATSKDLQSVCHYLMMDPDTGFAMDRCATVVEHLNCSGADRTRVAGHPIQDIGR